MLEELIAWVLLIALVLYALLGGADFGGGLWDLFATGQRARRQRDLISDAIGPIWEANHVWLILVVVLLFTAFPRGFAVIMTALHIPILLMLLGIVLRGSAFVFRKYDVGQRARVRWSTIFGVSSLLTPFVQGMMVGALASGRIRSDGGIVTSGYFAGWLTPFAFACGLFALVLFAFLAAVYLCVDAEDDPSLQADFRLRALISGLSLGPIAALVFFSAQSGAPVMYEALTKWWAPVLQVLTGTAALAALVALWMRWFRIARIAAGAQVTLILFGWCISQFPYLVVPDLTVRSTAAPEITLKLLISALALGSIILFPSLYYLFKVFKGRPER